jgi:hypothetical protein
MNPLLGRDSNRTESLTEPEVSAPVRTKKTKIPTSPRLKEKRDRSEQNVPPSATIQLPLATHSAPKKRHASSVEKLAAARTLQTTLNEVWGQGDWSRLLPVLRDAWAKGVRFEPPLFPDDASMRQFRSVAIMDVFVDGSTDDIMLVVEYLIRMGCSPNARDAMDNDVLMYACKAGNHRLVNFLLNECDHLEAGKLNKLGRNAAMVANDNPYAQFLPQLEAAGIVLRPVNPAIDWFHSHPLALAGSAGAENQEQLAELLSQDHYMNLADEAGMTLLFYAVLAEDIEAVRFLCKYPDKPLLTLRDNTGLTVFNYAQAISESTRRSEIFSELTALSRDAGVWLSEQAAERF